MTNPRFGDLASILSKAPANPPADPPETSGTVTRLDQPRVPARNRDDRSTTPRPKKPTAPASSAASGGVRRVAFRLSPDLHDALVARAAAAKTSHGQIVLDAVEDAAGRDSLGRLVDPPEHQTSSTGLFPRLQSRPLIEASIPVEIRLDARAVAILDQLVTQHGAKSRTHLITVALRDHLTVDTTQLEA